VKATWQRRARRIGGESLFQWEGRDSRSVQLSSSPACSSEQLQLTALDPVPGHRRATVSTALGYATADGVRVFQGTVNGSLATEPRGTFGFGYDSNLVPDNDTSQRTYAQMTSEEKNKISHRRRAVEEMRSALGLA
jgi:non-canonical purine NTP pyrophosphatase (RdgB/HAM1 family)